MKGKIITASLAFVYTGCLAPDFIPHQYFGGLESAELNDFTLPNYVQYFELRQGPIDSSYSFEHIPLLRFDPLGYEQLDIGQQIDIEFIDTTNGFLQGCAPNNCPIYIASVGESLSVVDSIPLLKSFLGALDRPAEFALWIKQWGFTLLEFYAFEDGSYSLIVVQENAEGTQETYQLFVSQDGEILSQIKIETLTDKVEGLH